MKFEFDPKKNTINLKKHGISLEDAKELWSTDFIIIPAKNLSEPRWAIIGELQEKIYMAIYTLRNKNIRLISCHRASKKLERFFYEKIKNK